MNIEVPNAEILDKRWILQLQKNHVKVEGQMKIVDREIADIDPLCQTLFDKYGPDVQKLYVELSRIISKLWDIEHSIRDCERDQCFDSRFVELARSIYKTNDERARVKREINILTESDLVEEKHYQ